MSAYYRLNGHTAVPCIASEWTLQDIEVRRVAFTKIDEHAEVSTAFLGTNHNWLDDGPPLLFETMVFRDGDGDYDWTRRYSTWDEAQAGHYEVVRLLLLANL